MTRKISKIVVSLTVLILVAVGAFYLATEAGESEYIRQLVLDYGYIGIFFLSFISGFNLAIPVPAVAFLPLFVASGLNFWISIFLISVGITIADALGFLIGKFSRHIVLEDNKTVQRLEKIKERYQFAPHIVLFLFASFAPFPNEILVIPMAFLGYRMRILLPIVFFGNLIFNILYATGISSIFSVINK